MFYQINLENNILVTQIVCSQQCSSLCDMTVSWQLFVTSVLRCDARITAALNTCIHANVVIPAAILQDSLIKHTVNFVYSFYPDFLSSTF